MINDTLRELGATEKSIEEMRKSRAKSYGAVGKILWEIRRKGEAKRKEVFDALRVEGVRFGGRVSSALWALVGDLQTCRTWDKACDDRADLAAREAASAETKKKKSAKSEYDKLLDSLDSVKKYVEKDDDVLEALDTLVCALARAKAAKDKLKLLQTVPATPATPATPAKTGDAKAA